MDILDCVTLLMAKWPTQAICIACRTPLCQRCRPWLHRTRSNREAERSKLPRYVETALSIRHRVRETRDECKTLHKVLADTRINERQEFFRLDLSQIKLPFSPIDGEWRKDTPIPIASTEDNDECSLSSTARSTRGTHKKLRDYLKDGQRVRHILSGQTLVAIYNAKLDSLCIGTTYMGSVHKLVHHHESITKKKASHTGYWKQCERDVDGTWVILDNMPPLSPG